MPGGTDLAGDAYNANDPNSVPMPDGNPMDSGLSGGHGTGTASLIGGLGENNDGSTYTGRYDATNPSISNLKISPGFAPKALLYPVKVFGSVGSTNLVTQAIDWAMQNDMDVINMSLGSNEGFADDPDAVAASNAAAAGIIVCSLRVTRAILTTFTAALRRRPGTLSVAASFNDQIRIYFRFECHGQPPACPRRSEIPFHLWQSFSTGPGWWFGRQCCLRGAERWQS